MNKKQRVTISIGIFVVFLMLLIPPYYAVGRYDTNFAGYGFIFAPENRFKLMLDDGIYFVQSYSASVRLDFVRLSVQVLLVIVLTGGIVFLFHHPKKD